MRRNWELTREILRRMHDAEPGEELFSLRLREYQHAEVREHLLRAADDGLIVARSKNLGGELGLVVIAERLTSAGYALAEHLENDTNWNHIQRYARERGLALTIEVVRQVALELIKRAVQ